jgi:hypothetical protein
MFILFCGLAVNGLSIVPGYYGARSLSLGYGSTSFNYDINSMFINPAILSSVNYTLSGYQYQNSYLDYKNFGENLSSLLEYGLKDFEAMDSAAKSALFSGLKDLYQSKTGMYGFLCNTPGFISRGYGMSVSLVNTAIISPVAPGENGIFSKDIDDVTNADIASLKMNFTGLKYKRISLSYSLQIYNSVNLGVSLHYLNGKITEFDSALVDENVFTAANNPKDYLEHAWGNADEKFNKFIADVGLNVNLGKFFKAGLVMRNFANAKIKTPEREIALPRRVIAGLAFRPDVQWGIYLDMDIKPLDLLHNGTEMQPLSIGVEKGFFKNKFFVRAGMLNDLTEKHFFGKKSNALYGLGVGFNMRKIIVDFAIGIDNGGSIKNLAVSGFILVK